MADSLFGDIVSWMQSPQRTQQMRGIGDWLSEWPKRYQENQQINKLAGDYTQNKLLGRTPTPEQEQAHAAWLEQAAGSVTPAGMIVGRGVTAANAARATQMANTGASPGRIFQETGLVQVPTPNGMAWGRQISDAPAQMKSDVYDNLKDVFQHHAAKAKGQPIPEPTLADLLDHPELFQTYPELANLPVQRLSGLESFSGTKGSFNPATGTIKLAGKNQYFTPEQLAKQREEVSSTLLHEIQHAIQSIEQWPRGGSPSEFAKKGTAGAENQVKWAEKSLDQLVRSKMEELKLPRPSEYSLEYLMANVRKFKTEGEKALKYYDAPFVEKIKTLANLPEFSSFEKIYTKLDKVKKKVLNRRQQEFEKYQSLAGEAQSRATQAQFLLDKQTGTSSSYSIPATSFYDVPIETLIYKDPFPNTIK
jgi:hypothetical protein